MDVYHVLVVWVEPPITKKGNYKVSVWSMSCCFFFPPSFELVCVWLKNEVIAKPGKEALKICENSSGR